MKKVIYILAFVLMAVCLFPYENNTKSYQDAPEAFYVYKLSERLHWTEYTVS
ncbi:MAG: hypothetical protein UIM24_06325 [Clostridia bacterium]|nr:hypothetical protein [Clostridia bacterium]